MKLLTILLCSLSLMSMALTKEEIQQLSETMKVGETKNGYIKLPSGRMHFIRGVITNSSFGVQKVLDKPAQPLTPRVERIGRNLPPKKSPMRDRNIIKMNKNGEMTYKIIKPQDETKE